MCAQTAASGALVIVASLCGLVLASTAAKAVQTLLQPELQGWIDLSGHVLPDKWTCAATEDIPVAGANLTARELEILPHLCWSKNGRDIKPLKAEQGRGIPPGVKCNVTQW